MQNTAMFSMNIYTETGTLRSTRSRLDTYHIIEKMALSPAIAGDKATGFSLNINDRSLCGSFSRLNTPEACKCVADWLDARVLEHDAALPVYMAKPKRVFLEFSEHGDYGVHLTLDEALHRIVMACHAEKSGGYHKMFFEYGNEKIKVYCADSTHEASGAFLSWFSKVTHE